ncbi:SRPBCC family protein [Patulibacter sp. NPDC049589]|uniref:SRPBCC family protein n=1 Tax=Patulibacter sp. NPDC049589 TaxID=3154731 RepID=UPI00341AFB14
MRMTDRGTHVEYEGRPAVRFVRRYPHSTDRVWAAVSTPEELVRWFPSRVELETRAGGTIRFSGDPYMEPTTGTVLAYAAPRRLAFTRGEDEVHLTLESLADGGTTLTLINVLEAPDTAARNAGGWPVCLVVLDRWLAGEETAGPHHAPEEWEPVHDAYVADGLPSGAPVPGTN